jgi:hypothetical protein
MLAALRDGLAWRLIEFVAQRLDASRASRRARVSTSSRTMAGVAITPDTAVTVAAVWACLRYLSQTVAVLPWHVMRDGKNGRRDSVRIRSTGCSTSGRIRNGRRSSSARR